MHHPPPPAASLGGGFKSIQGATTWNPTGTLRDKWVLNFHEDSRRGWHTKCVGGILATHNNIINSSSIVCLLRASNNSSRDTKTIMVAGRQHTPLHYSAPCSVRSCDRQRDNRQSQQQQQHKSTDGHLCSRANIDANSLHSAPLFVGVSRWRPFRHEFRQFAKLTVTQLHPQF